MANVDAPFGLRPVRHRNGASYNGAVNKYYVPSTYATALYIGEAVTKTGTSNTTEVEGNQPGTLPEVNKTAAGDGNAITGVIVGFGPNRDDLSKQYRPASTERVVYVADDPDLVFEIRDDGGVALDATVVGLNAVLIDTESGSTTTGLAGTEMDSGTTDAPAADASNQLTIQRLVDKGDNALGVNAVWEVKINNHTEAHAALGI
jgi:hypothetical protein